MFKWFDEESRIAGCRKYTEEEKRYFYDEYARQGNKLTGDSDTGDVPGFRIRISGGHHF